MFAGKLSFEQEITYKNKPWNKHMAGNVFGVPQESIPGSILFKMFLSDLFPPVDMLTFTVILIIIPSLIFVAALKN